MVPPRARGDARALAPTGGSARGEHDDEHEHDHHQQARSERGPAPLRAPEVGARRIAAVDALRWYAIDPLVVVVHGPASYPLAARRARHDPSGEELPHDPA